MASGSCDIPDLQLVEEFEAPTFETTSIIRWVHQSTPRFGHSNDLLQLMTGSQEEQRDYVKGLIASAIAIFGLFLIWLIFLAVFRCMGPYEVGILSGKPRPLPSRPPYNSGELVSWQQQRSQADKKLNRLRMAVCVCGIVIVFSACLMAVKGVSSLTQSLDNGTDAIALSENLANRAIRLIDRVTKQNRATGNAIDTLLEDINDICPRQRPDGICTDLDDVSTCAFDGIFDNDIIENTIRHFKEAETSIYFQELVNVQTDLREFLVVTEDLNDKAESFNWALYCSLIGTIILMILCLFIIFGMAFPSSKVFGCLRNVILVPAFTLLVIIAFLFSMVFVVGSMASADLCYNSPDENILVILNRFRQQVSPIAVEIASFYINSCPPEAIPEEISTQLNFVLDTIPTLGNFSSLLNQNTNALQQLCGFENPNPIASAAESANVQLCQIVDVLNSIRLFFQCENWFPLYKTTVYDAICYNGTDGLVWIASTQFVIVFFSCLLLTLRASFHELTIEQEDDDDSIKANAIDNDSLGEEYNRSTVVSTPSRSPAKVTPSTDDDGFEMSLSPSRSAKTLRY